MINLAVEVKNQAKTIPDALFSRFRERMAQNSRLYPVFYQSLLQKKSVKFPENLLDAAFLESGAVQGCVIENDSIFYRFGPAFFSFRHLLQSYLTSRAARQGFGKISAYRILDHDVNLYAMHVKGGFTVLLLFTETPADSGLKKIINILGHYYVNKSGISNHGAEIDDVFAAMNRELLEEIGESEGGGMLVQIKLQDLESYFSIIGTHKCLQFFRSIQATIEDKTGERQLYWYSMRLLICFVPEYEVDRAREDFEEMFIQVGEMIVDYNLYFYPVPARTKSLDDFWKKIAAID